MAWYYNLGITCKRSLLKCEKNIGKSVPKIPKLFYFNGLRREKKNIEMREINFRCAKSEGHAKQTKKSLGVKCIRSRLYRS